jgi:RTX calcium-binding nonapeptide repeat (4 copies)
MRTSANGAWTSGEEESMSRATVVLFASALVLGVSQLTTASAQEQPLCGPPGEEVPATIVGAGTINGTPGDDVIVGSADDDIIRGGPGDDIICAEGGNDVVSGGPGTDTLIGDGADLPPFIPSNGTNDDRLSGGPGDDLLAGLGGGDTMEGGPGDDQLIGFGGDDRSTAPLARIPRLEGPASTP